MTINLQHLPSRQCRLVSPVRRADVRGQAEVGRKSPGGGPAQVFTTPTDGSPVQREVGPAAALLQEAGSRQLGWEPFVLREVCGDKQQLIIGHFIRAAATDQLLTQCLSEGPPSRIFPSCVLWTLSGRLACCQSSFKEQGSPLKSIFSKWLFVRLGNWFSKCVPLTSSVTLPGKLMEL